MTTQTFPVAGLTCGHCVGAVVGELEALPGVKDVSVDLVAGGTSTVTIACDSPIGEGDLIAALQEAGDYQLVTD